MVDMANAIDFRLGHCDGEFHALRSKIEKSKNGLFLPTWKLLSFSGFQVHVHGKLQEKNPRTGTKLSNFSTFSVCSQKPETSKAHMNNSRNIVTREN